MYFITLTELNTKSDLKAVVGAISNVLHVDKKTAVEYAKNFIIKIKRCKFFFIINQSLLSL